MNMSPPPHTLERANPCGRSHVRHQRALRRRAHRERRRGESAQHLSAPPRSANSFARVPRRCCSCTTLTLARRHTCSERHPDVDDACAAARERPERRFLERRCSASTAMAQPLPIASLRRAECSAAIAVEESKRSAPAVARSLDRRAACELLSRCQLPVTHECAAAPAWRLHRRTDAFAFATNTAGLGTSAPAIWPRVAPADCPLPRREMLFSTFRVNVQEVEHLESVLQSSSPGREGKNATVDRERAQD